MSMSVMLSGIAVGTAFGFVLQRGRFCLNTACRNAFYIKEFTLLRAYVLALVTAVISAHLLEHFGFLHLSAVRQPLAVLANSLGGYVFGVGMVLAGGDAGSSWSRTGEGLVGSWMAVLGLMLGAAAVGSGVLAGVSADLRGFVPLSGTAPSLYGDSNIYKWTLIVLLSLAGLVFVFKGRTAYVQTQPGYSGKTTGLLVGLLVVLGLLVSERMEGTATGITFSGPSGTLLASLVASRHAGWGVALVAGVPLGSFLSAWRAHEFSWRAPRAEVMAQQLVGGLLMGSGGMIAGGCSIGHGLTGLAALSLASLVSTTGIVLGCWTMVYLLFMRNVRGST